MIFIYKRSHIIKNIASNRINLQRFIKVVFLVDLFKNSQNTSLVIFNQTPAESKLEREGISPAGASKGTWNPWMRVLV